MITPPTPHNEIKRIETLHLLNILDTSAEERFDRITRLARRLFGVPIVLISLVDTDRQWFKSTMGIDLQETPRNTSFCGHAILDDAIMVVPDALSDERFNDNPAVICDPHVRFYAGCPLQVGEGVRLGTLCLIDHEPRGFTKEDQDLLRDLAVMVEQEMVALQLASLDELTLLSNRRGIEVLGQYAFSVCQRLDRPMTVTFIDLDRFKLINNQFGHAEGDRALRDFARILRECYRDSDVIGRLGGDEFAVIMTDTEPASARVVINRLKVALEQYQISESRGYCIEFSAGCKSVDFSRHSCIADALADADVLMYEAKRARN